MSCNSTTVSPEEPQYDTQICNRSWLFWHWISITVAERQRRPDRSSKSDVPSLAAGQRRAQSAAASSTGNRISAFLTVPDLVEVILLIVNGVADIFPRG